MEPLHVLRLDLDQAEAGNLKMKSM